MIYLTCTLVITTLSMVLTVLVLNVYGTTDHPVPAWMRDFVLIYIARALGMCDTARTYQEAKNNVLLTLTDSRGCVLTLTDQRKLALTRTDPRKLAPTRAPEA